MAKKKENIFMFWNVAHSIAKKKNIEAEMSPAMFVKVAHSIAR